MIPVLQKEWQMSNTAAGSVLSAYHTGFLISIVALAALSDWVSPKKVFFYSSIAFAASCLLFAFFARSYLSAFLLRGLMGLCLGGTYTPVLKLISENFSSAHRGRAMGFFIGAGSLGHAGSLAATGWLAARYDWQTTFFLTSLGPILGAMIPLFILWGMAERKPEPQGKMLKKEVLANRPALLMIAGYGAHTWELEGQRAWTPAFLVACYLAMGLTKDQALQSGAVFSSVMYIMGVVSTSAAGYWSDRWGRTAVIIAMMAISISCSFSFGWLIGSPIAMGDDRGAGLRFCGDRRIPGLFLRSIGTCLLQFFGDRPGPALPDRVRNRRRGSHGLRAGAGPHQLGGNAEGSRLPPELGLGFLHAGGRGFGRALGDAETPFHAGEPDDGRGEEIADS